MWSRKLLVIYAFAALLQQALSLKILAIASLPLRSHYMAFQSLFRELAIRGHSVTVMNNYPDESPLPNLHFIDLRQHNNSAGFMTPLEYYETFDSSFLHLYNFYRHFSLGPPSTRADCANFFTNQDVKSHLSSGIKYDVIFVEQFMGDCGLVYAGVVYDAPIIGITSHVMLPLAYTRLGIPFDFSADSFYFSKGGPNPSLYHRIEALIMNFLYIVPGRLYMQNIIHEIFNQHLANDTIDIERLATDRIKMMFAYQHFSLTGSRLLPPQVLEIGGIHIDKPKPVAEDIESFFSSAKDGVIYVSFGSNLKSNTMSNNKLQQFLTAFKNIKQKVIWKYENGSFPAGHDNVFAGTWLPQLDILCHPKVVGFVSHGGMLSLSETAHCGKPVLVIPFFGDQFTNAAGAKTVGIGNILYFDQLNADNLERGIKQLTSPEMQRNAKRVSQLWNDRPQSAMDSAIYWTEYVARHGTAPPPLPSQRVWWFEHLLLEFVVVLLIFALVIVLSFVYRVLTTVIKNALVFAFCKGKAKKE